MDKTASDVKEIAKEFRKRFKLQDITYSSLSEVFRKQGFTIIEFNPIVNDDDVSTVIRNLGLEEAVLREKGFLYTDHNYRLVFINEKLSDVEKALVLAHEEGHFYLGHFSHKSIIGKDVQEEYEANEFVHYLNEKSVYERFRRFCLNHKKSLIRILIGITLLGGGAVAGKQYHDWKLYAGTYYVTVYGEKYHLKNCVTIQGHKTRRLTKEDIDSGQYEACNVCMPDRG